MSSPLSHPLLCHRPFFQGQPSAGPSFFSPDNSLIYGSQPVMCAAATAQKKKQWGDRFDHLRRGENGFATNVTKTHIVGSFCPDFVKLIGQKLQGFLRRLELRFGGTVLLLQLRIEDKRVRER